MAQKELRIDKFRRLVSQQSHIRNVCTSAHIHHGKTALTDNLLAAAGMMASKNAGDLDSGMMTWQHADEQERLLTVDSANVSMVHESNGQEYLINLIDTPGHIDFSGNVTSAMRAVDGTIVLVCASEGIMPQTETVIKQALRERVKPVLFINKFDRLIKELKLGPEAMQDRIVKIIANFNKLIEKIAEPEYKEKWKVNIGDGSVAFGSARDNWALSLPFMKKKNVSFKDITKIYDMEETEMKEWCWKNAPLYEVILDMVIKHHPSPVDAQKYRIPKIWNGDPDSEFGKDLLACNPNGKLAFIITKIIVDTKTGKELSVGRLFSGTVYEGMDVYLNNAKLRQKIQQVFIYDGIKAESLKEIPAGNVLALGGIVANTSETITSEPETSFEEIRHIFEPVVTEAIESKKASDLPKLISVLKQVGKEDPCIRVQINEETGQHLISGMGELHLEIITNRIRTEKNVEISTSPPIVVYRESITKASGEFEGRSPNKHNVFTMTVEPLEDAVYQAIKNKEIPETKVKKKDELLFKKLTSLGIENDEAKQYKEIYRDCVLLDKTRGEVHIGEVIELVMTAFEQIVDQGVLSREPSIKLKVSLIDTKLHEDAIHRGPAQVIPAVRDAIRSCVMDARPVLYEPLQEVQVEAPINFVNEVTKIIQSRRGQMMGAEQEEDHLTMKCTLPVSEMFGLSNDLRSSSEGRATFYIIDQSFARIPSDLQEKTIRQIRQRKGLAEGQ
ncbi:MAG: elongation factor EF-2 [Candidatus Pacearchaeota archaeon]|nr:elongation factor EF-2 [Candidatus Pacearchaeota archaeon]